MIDFCELPPPPSDTVWTEYLAIVPSLPEYLAIDMAVVARGGQEALFARDMT